MLEDEQELRYAYEAMARLNRLRERSAREPAWDDEGRKQVVAGIEAQMRKIEREIADYLAQNPRAKAA